MTFFTYLGTLTSPGTTGNQVITDPGFQPKAVIFFDGANGAGALFRVSHTAGASQGAAQQVSQANNSSSTGAVPGYRRDVEAINHWLPVTSTVEKTATLVSFNATGFTLNWSPAVAGASISYLAIGGTDVEVASGTLPVVTATGNQSLTGLSFTPKLVLFNFGTYLTNQGQGFGAATSATARWSTWRSSAQTFSMSTSNLAARLQETTKCINSTSTSGANFNVADFVSMNADGFTINWITQNGAVGTSVGWLAFGGNATFSVGNFVKAASTSQTSITVDAGLPVAPQAYILVHETATNNTAQTTGWRSGFGATDGTRSRAMAYENKNLVLPTQAQSVSDTTKVLRQRALPASVSAAGAEEVAMAHNAFTSTGFTVDLTTNAVAVAYVYPYITFGPSSAAPGVKDITGSATGVASVSQALRRTRALTATATGLSTATGTISKIGAVVYKDLVASGAGAATTTATPTRRRPLVASAVGVGATTATPTRKRPLIAAATGVASVTVTLVRTRALTATATGLAVASGTISKIGAVVYKDIAGLAAGIATVTQLLTRRRALVASSTGSSVTTATPSRRRVLAAAAAGLGSAAGTLTARRVLTAAATGVASVMGYVDKAGSVFRPIFGNSVGRATSAGQIARRRALVALSTGVASVTALLTRRRPLTAGSVGLATTTAVPTRRRALAAASAGRATTSGTVSAGAVLPLTSVIWAGDHFEMGTVGTLVGWNGAIHQFDTSSTQVVWEDDRFEVAA